MKRILGYREYLDLIEKLYEKVRNEKPDAVLAVLKGGYYPAKFIADRLGVPLLSMGIRSYHGQEQGEIEIYKPVKIPKEYKNVLAVDDLTDTGKTAEKVKEICKEQGVDVKLAVLFNKPWSEIKPDYFVSATKDWIVFPYERGPVHRALFALYFWFNARTKLI